MVEVGTEVGNMVEVEVEEGGKVEGARWRGMGAEEEVVAHDDGDEDKEAERAVAVEVAVLGKYTSEATAMLPEVMLVMEVSAVVTPAAAANWVRKEALNEAEKLAASKAVMSRPAKYTVEVTTSTISCPGGGGGGVREGTAVVGLIVVGCTDVGCTLVGCRVAGESVGGRVEGVEVAG
ncbi:hypothetical protein CYMTET_11199 [Cymbomonas tetramitiformis]|uniref:Uncharacterized protein n=1 Tax=Cymbomonas tetramitiformis TaxID=36881 RepID=A0AAE0GML9_9CHLO|nr:hypothetical protein CYMTET_11199 [Cymbomonas tetramitiformis]